MVHGIYTRQAESAVAKTTVIILLISITSKKKKNRITFALTISQTLLRTSVHLSVQHVFTVQK